MLLLCFASVILGDNTAESLLLANYGADIVAKLFSLNALLLFLFSLSMISLIDRIDRGTLFSRFLLVHSIILGISWVLLLFQVKWIVIPLFSYAYVSKIFTFLLFWTLANDIVDSRKAVRDFPRIAAGGTLGAIGISFLIPQIVGKVNAEFLLPVWASLNALVLLLFQPIRNQFGRNFAPSHIQENRKKKREIMKEDVVTIGKDPLLISMALFYFLLFFVLLNQQFAFYSVLKSRYSEATELSSFLGYFNGISMIITFLLQMSLSGFVIKKIGSTRAMLILPIVFCIVFISLGISPYFGISSVGSDTLQIIFWGTVAGLGLRIAVFDSFYSPNFQIFFSSLPKAIRGRGKIALEGVVKPFAMIFASFWLTLIMPKLPHYLNTIILVASSLAMVFLALLMRKQYTKSLTRYLGDFKSKGATTVTNLLKDHNVVQKIEATIASEPEEVQCYMIELLGDIDSQPALNVLIKLLNEGDEKLLPTILDTLTPKAIPHLKKQFRKLIEHENPLIVREAMLALAEYKDEKEALLSFVHSEILELKLTVIELLWWDVDHSMQKEMLSEINKGLQSSNPEKVFRTLDLCGRVDAPELTDTIPSRFPLFTDPLLQNQKGWNRFTAALAELEGEVILNWILQNSNNLSAAKLPSLVPAIYNIIKGGFLPERVLRKMITASREERYLLASGLLMYGRPLKHLKRRIKPIFEEELQHLSEQKKRVQILLSRKRASELLRCAIEEELLTLHLHTAVALVALLDKKGEIRRIVNRLESREAVIRARALEILDNVGDMRMNNQLIEHFSPLQPAKVSEDEFDNSLVYYKHFPNPWIQECAHFSIRCTNLRN